MADTDKSLSPEKRLLQLIEEPGQSSKEHKKPPSENLQTLFSARMLQERLTRFWENLQQLFTQKRKKFGIQDANKLIMIFGICLTVIFCINAVFDMNSVSKELQGVLDMPVAEVGDVGFVEHRMFETSDMENMHKRNIFLPFARRSEKKVAEQSELSLQIIAMTENLRLTGISFNPHNSEEASCMVEDIAKNITTFLRVGDEISGLRVEHIKEDHIILKFQDETVEIR